MTTDDLKLSRVAVVALDALMIDMPESYVRDKAYRLDGLDNLAALRWVCDTLDVTRKENFCRHIGVAIEDLEATKRLIAALSI